MTIKHPGWGAGWQARQGRRKDNEWFVFKMLFKRGFAGDFFLSKAAGHGEKQ